MPPSPNKGDEYIVSDNGNASVNNVTIDGNGLNIDGGSTLVLSTNFASVTMRYTGVFWKVIAKI